MWPINKDKVAPKVLKTSVDTQHHQVPQTRLRSERCIGEAIHQVLGPKVDAMLELARTNANKKRKRVAKVAGEVFTKVEKKKSTRVAATSDPKHQKFKQF